MHLWAGLGPWGEVGLVGGSEGEGEAGVPESRSSERSRAV